MISSMKAWLTAGAFAAVSLGAAAPSALAAADEACVVNPRGQILALSCASCHGTDGRSVGIIPGFYGKSPEYLEMALKDFKSGKRYSTVMIRHAKGYTDEEIKLIAEYFGTVWQNDAAKTN